MDDAVAYQVLGYSDVRDVAVDAAATALERQEQRTSEDLRLLANEAAASAAAAVADQVGQASEEELRSISDAAANTASYRALEGVQESLDAQLAEIEQRSESLESVTVALDDAQYQALMLAYRRQLGVSFLTLLMVSICAGILLWGFVSREFR